MNGTTRVLIRIVVALGVAVPNGDVLAQTISGRLLIGSAWSSIRLDDVTERVSGLWSGGALDVQMGPITITGSGARGWLRSDIPFEPLERDAAEVSVAGRFAPQPWLHFELRYVARVFRSPPSRQRWDMLGVGIAASRALGTPALRAAIDATYLPFVSVGGIANSHAGLAGEVGIEAAPSRLPLIAALNYRIERFDFSSPTLRREQFEAFTVSLGMRLRRVEGRWTLFY